MSSTIEATAPVGMYAEKVVDYSTQLIGPITDSIIDADRLTQGAMPDAIPCWELYRAALAGDDLYIPRLRDWAVSFALAYCKAGGVRSDAYSEELAFTVGLDALHIVLFSRPLLPYDVAAHDLGVGHKTYKRLRDVLSSVWLAALNEYWWELLFAYRKVRQRERGISSEPTKRISSVCAPAGTSPLFTAEGNYYISPAPNPDNI